MSFLERGFSNMQTEKKNTLVLSIPAAREQLRRRSVACASALSRSVARMTSCDALPCVEYSSEVQAERSLIDELLYVQCCRATLEQCVAGGSASLRYTRQDGTAIMTQFQRSVQGGRVRIRGLAPADDWPTGPAAGQPYTKLSPIPDVSV